MHVADAVERRDHLVRELPRLLDDGRDEILAEVAVQAFAARRLEAGNVVEREQNVGDRGGIGHGPSLG